MTRKQSVLLFAGLCALCVLASVVYGVIIARKARPVPEVAASTSKPPAELAPETPQAMASTPKPPSSTVVHAKQAVVPAAIKSTPPVKPAAPLLYFRANQLGDQYGKLSVASADAPDQRKYAPDLYCDRVYFSHGIGICLTSNRGVFTTYSAVRFGEDLKRGWSIPLNGEPSRTRVSPSGRLASITVFVSGHSYTALNFSTKTMILDTAKGDILADLETLSVSRDGTAWQSADFNFWGVTFQQNENRFYATLWSKGKTYLVDCDLIHRTAQVIHEDVECPSLSPDNTRIAFKRRTGSPRALWRIYALDLKTMVETQLGEPRNVDDQVEWLDNSHILYALSQNEKGGSASSDIWELPATPDGTPSILLKGGFSPAVVRAKAEAQAAANLKIGTFSTFRN
jgi:hypothetical protein